MAGAHIFRPRFFANLFSFLARFHDSKIPLNIREYWQLTKARPGPPIPGERLALVFPRCSNNIPGLTLIQNISAKILQNRKAPHPATSTVRRRKRES
jgi:hypothetical protein